MTPECLDRGKISPGTIFSPPHRLWLQDNRTITSVISQFSRMNVIVPRARVCEASLYVEAALNLRLNFDVLGGKT